MGTWGWTVRLVRVVWVAVLLVAIYRVLSYGGIAPALAYVLLFLSVLILVTAFPPLVGAAPAEPRLVPAVSSVLAGSTVVSLGFALGLHFIGRGTPAPPAFVTDVSDPAQFDSVLAYARRLVYDSATHGTADSAFLTDTEGGALPKVKAWMAPARGANFLSYRNLEGMGPGRGRVVARVRVDTAGGLGYPLLNLPAGVSYIWVDSLALRDSTGVFRALIIPAAPGGRVARFPRLATFIYVKSPGTFANFPMSRWVLHHSLCFNTGCSSGCCRVCPD
jgi:hypothetical protein